MMSLIVLLFACTGGEGLVGLNELGGVGLIDDDHGERSAWAEFYNGSGEDASLEGWTLSYGGTEWVASTLSVPAGSTLLLWMDAEPEQSSQHTSFALLDAGGEMTVHNSDGRLVQDILIPELHTGASFGRRPDGVANWQVIDDPSPGALNRE